LLDGGKIGVKTIEDISEGGVVITDEGFAGEGHEKSNLHVDLGRIDAVESAVELGVGEDFISVGVEGVFFGDKFLGGDKAGVGVGADGFEVSRKLREGTINDAREGRIDGAKLGGLEIGVVIVDEIINIIHAEVKLFDGVGGLGGAILEK